MISFATRFQNIGPVQEPCAHPCCCDQLTGPWAVWMVTFLSRVVESSEKDLFQHFAYGWKQCHRSVGLNFIRFFAVLVEKEDNSLFQRFWKAV
ncbi:hypothetical protein AVEN_230783-1 [Araneus ventricosus]|uniref:Uncharacterized protein n=1 Tax=Araneus ventricosus TaxID=182803 RepID=A0A4Y2A221_ARAVE|nr:hypothetical protein AVEN_230783-1 [Araneus ventricosus]